MISFIEHMAQQRGAGLPDPLTMLDRMGISPTGPHDVEVQRMVKRREKRALAQPILKSRAKVAQTALGRGPLHTGSAAI